MGGLTAASFSPENPKISKNSSISRSSWERASSRRRIFFALLRPVCRAAERFQSDRSSKDLFQDAFGVFSEFWVLKPVQPGQMPEFIRRKRELQIGGRVFPRDGAIVCILTEYRILLGAELQDVHRFTSFAFQIKMRELKRTPAAHFLSTANAISVKLWNLCNPLREAPCGHRLTGTALHRLRQTLKLFVSTIILCGNAVFVKRQSFLNADRRWRSGCGRPLRG